MQYFVGIDIGKNGGIAIIDEKGNLATMATPKVGNQIDVGRIKQFLLSYENPTCVIEDVHSIFGTSAKSNFQFGRSAGIIEGLVVGLGFRFVLVSPKEWQKEMWQGVNAVLINTGKTNKKGEIKYKTDTKATSLIAAKRLFPNFDFRATGRSTKDHDGIVDSVLMAEFCRRKFR